MKKIFYLTIASVVALAGCTKFAHDAAFEPINTGAPVISETSFDESSLAFKVSAADENTCFYTFAVIEGPADKLDPEAMLADKYAEDAIAHACVDASETPFVEMELDDLESGEAYTLYVVANSKNGMVSEMKTFTFELPDYNPLDITFENAVVTNNILKFSISSSTNNVYYFADYTDDDLDGVSDEDLIASTKAYIQKWADSDELSFEEEYLEYFAYKGSDGITSYNLESNTTYTAYGFFMAADGTVMSEVFREKFTTLETVLPTEATGTYTYCDAFFGPAADAGMEAEFNATKDTLTIKNWGAGMDFKCAIDADGNANVPVQQVYEHPTVGPIYIAEIDNLTGRAKATSFYNVADKTLYLSVYYVYVGEDGLELIGGGYNCETFCFDGSQPAEGPTNAGIQKEFKLGNLGKVSSIAEPVKHKHICR